LCLDQPLAEARSVRPGQNARSPAACGAGPDASGIELLTIRSLAAQPMSVYHHAANKDEVLDGIVDVVLSEIDLPPGDGDWRADIRRRASSARRVLRCHPWALGLLESRTTPAPPHCGVQGAFAGDPTRCTRPAACTDGSASSWSTESVVADAAAVAAGEAGVTAGPQLRGTQDPPQLGHVLGRDRGEHDIGRRHHRHRLVRSAGAVRQPRRPSLHRRQGPDRASARRA